MRLMSDERRQRFLGRCSSPKRSCCQRLLASRGRRVVLLVGAAASAGHACTSPAAANQKLTSIMVGSGKVLSDATKLGSKARRNSGTVSPLLRTTNEYVPREKGSPVQDKALTSSAVDLNIHKASEAAVPGSTPFSSDEIQPLDPRLHILAAWVCGGCTRKFKKLCRFLRRGVPRWLLHSLKEDPVIAAATCALQWFDSQDHYRNLEPPNKKSSKTSTAAAATSNLLERTSPSESSRSLVQSVPLRTNASDPVQSLREDAAYLLSVLSLLPDAHQKQWNGWFQNKDDAKINLLADPHVGALRRKIYPAYAEFSQGEETTIQRLPCLRLANCAPWELTELKSEEFMNQTEELTIMVGRLLSSQSARCVPRRFLLIGERDRPSNNGLSDDGASNDGLTIIAIGEENLVVGGVWLQQSQDGVISAYRYICDPLGLLLLLNRTVKLFPSLNKQNTLQATATGKVAGPEMFELKFAGKLRGSLANKSFNEQRVLALQMAAAVGRMKLLPSADKKAEGNSTTPPLPKPRSTPLEGRKNAFPSETANRKNSRILNPLAEDFSPQARVSFVTGINLTYPRRRSNETQRTPHRVATRPRGYDGAPGYCTCLQGAYGSYIPGYGQYPLRHSYQMTHPVNYIATPRSDIGYLGQDYGGPSYVTLDYETYGTPGHAYPTPAHGTLWYGTPYSWADATYCTCAQGYDVA